MSIFKRQLNYNMNDYQYTIWEQGMLEVVQEKVQEEEVKAREEVQEVVQNLASHCMPNICHENMEINRDKPAETLSSPCWMIPLSFHFVSAPKGDLLQL
jgi:hypothetical protein